MERLNAIIISQSFDNQPLATASEDTIRPNSLKLARLNEVKSDERALSLNRVKTKKYKITFKLIVKAIINEVISIKVVGFPDSPMDKKNPIKKISLKPIRVSDISFAFL